MNDAYRLDRAGTGDAVAASAAWRFHVLVGIANFAALRRQVGRGSGRTAADLVASRIALGMPLATVSTVAQDLVEICLPGDVERELDDILRGIRLACATPFIIDGEPIVIDVDIGAAAGLTDDADELRLIEEAESALEKARRTHRAVTRRVDRVTAEEAALAAELREAIACDQLTLQYQPKIHVRKQEVASAEALVRWEHPTRGMILPGDFISVAEQAQIVSELTLWVIRRAIRDQRRLAERGHDLRVFVNISGQLLADSTFVREASALVASSDARLGFEVTETSVIRDPDSAIANLQIFADIGIVIAIDDYGAGLSSLAYLKQLPARELKIDKLFVTQLTSSNRDPLIVRSTIDLAHALEMEVVAEGVESHAALALLTVMGCDMVQGFLISRPIAFDALVRYLDDDHQQLSPQQTRNSFTRLAQAWKR